MLRSLYSGISGMRNHQTRMDVTGNNISNVNTTGYKSARVNFQDTLSQTVRSGGDSRNAAQVGSGMTVGGISTNFTQGPMQSTGRSLDLFIQGNGMFVVKDPTTNNEYYTRDGVFFIDNQGYLVNSDGLRVQSKNGDIKIYNTNPVATINIGPDGKITGTDTAGNMLKFTSGEIEYGKDDEVVEAIFVGDKNGIIEPKAEIVANGPILKGDPISPFTPVVEAKLKGINDVVASLGITSTGVDLSSYELKITLNGGTEQTIDLSGLTSVTSWQDLVTKLQNAIDAKFTPGSIKVSYETAPYGGLVLETNGTPLGTTPEIQISGTDKEKFFGSNPEYTQGVAGKEGDWSGKKIQIDVGNGWQYIETDNSFSNVTSGADLAQKLQDLIDNIAGGNSNVTVTWSNDHLEFISNNTNSIKLGGADVGDLVGKASSAASSNMDWSTKSITVKYNGTTYNFSKKEMIDAGFDRITSGNALKDAMQKLIDDNIGANKIIVDWNKIDNEIGKLTFQTTNTPSDGTKPEIYIGGADAVDFVGVKPQITEGTAFSKGQPESGHYDIIRLVSFKNPEGLTKSGRNLYTKTDSSGNPAEANETSQILSGYLEMSNVDLTEEFTNMITTQRGYQASARVITVSDTLLEELIQLKR